MSGKLTIQPISATEAYLSVARPCGQPVQCARSGQLPAYTSGGIVDYSSQLLSFWDPCSAGDAKYYIDYWQFHADSEW